MREQLLIRVSRNLYAFGKLVPGVYDLLVAKGALIEFHKRLAQEGQDSANQFLADLKLPEIQGLNRADVSRGQNRDWILSEIQFARPQVGPVPKEVLCGT
jgi:hypothetical protein